MLRDNPPRWTKKVRPTVVAFLILFAFSFYGLHENSNVAAANHRLAEQVAQNVKVADYNKCIAINTGYEAVRAAKVQTEQVEIQSVVKLKQRFEEASRLNPPTTPQGAAAQAAGVRFFQQFVDDTTQLAKEGTAHVFDLTKPLNCGPDPTK